MHRAVQGSTAGSTQQCSEQHDAIRQYRTFRSTKQYKTGHGCWCRTHRSRQWVQTDAHCPAQSSSNASCSSDAIGPPPQDQPVHDSAHRATASHPVDGVHDAIACSYVGLVEGRGQVRASIHVRLAPAADGNTPARVQQCEIASLAMLLAVMSDATAWLRRQQTVLELCVMYCSLQHKPCTPFLPCHIYLTPTSNHAL